MKKRSFILSFILSITLLFNTAVCANDVAEKYTLEDLTSRLLEESLNIKQIELNEELLRLKYEDTLEEYNNSQKRVDDAEKALKDLKETLEKAKADYNNAANETERQNAYNNLQNLITTYSNAYQNYSFIIKSHVATMKSMEQISLQLEQLDRKKENEVALEKYNLQKDYYNLYILNRQLNLMEKELENVIKNIEIEKLKEKLNMTTSLEIENLEYQKRNLQLGIEQLKNNIELAVENMKTKLNIDVDEELNIEYIVTADTLKKEYSLSELIDEFKANSLELEVLENNIKVQEEIVKKYEALYEEDDNILKIARLELLQDRLNKISLEKDMEKYVKQVYYRYKQSLYNVYHNLEMKKFYKEKEKILEINYKQGLISEIEYRNQKLQIEKGLLEIEKAFIQLENNRTEIGLLTKGVMVN